MSRMTIAVLSSVLQVAAVLTLGAAPPPTPVAAAPAPPAPPAAPAPPAPPAPDDAEEILYLSPGGSWLGVSVEDVDAEKAKALGLKEETGVAITAVLPGGPAGDAGLKEGDVILRYQETRVDSAAQLTRMVRETPPGRTVTLQIFRGGATRAVKLKVAERRGRGFEGHGPHGMRIPRIEIPPIDIPDIEIPDIPELGGIPSSVRLGVQVERLNEQLGEYFGVKDAEGVLVRSVVKGSPADAAGLRAGDVLVKVDDETISDPSDLRSAIRPRRGKTVTLTVVRDRKEKTLTASLPKEERSAPEAAGSPGWKQDLNRKLKEAHEQERRIRIEMSDPAVRRGLEEIGNLGGRRGVI